MQNTAHNQRVDITEYSKSYQSQSPTISSNYTPPPEHHLPLYQGSTNLQIDSYAKDDINAQSGLLLQRNCYSIYEVKTLKQKIKASTLIKYMYSSRGYETKTASTFAHNPNQFTFLVTIGDTAVGTVTLGIDSNEGLLADELYQEELNTFRRKSRTVCELSKFALDPVHSSKEMIASLFQVTYAYAYKIHKATDFFCEVNPRHATPLKRMFGFRQISKIRTCIRVNAPAVLLHLELDRIRIQISSLKKTNKINEKAIYPYFLPENEIKVMADKYQTSKVSYIYTSHE